MTGRLALVTIGQSPRVDVLPDLLPLLEGREWAEYGALDLLTPDQLTQLAPQAGEPPLVSRMRDGSRVMLAHQRVFPMIVAAVERAAADGAAAALLMCTGHFEPFHTRIPLYPAESLAQQEIARTVTGFGVINPVPQQLAESQDRWQRRVGGEVPVAAADPYAGDDDALARAARALSSAGVTSIVLDCFGYSTAMAAIVREASGLPVHLTRLLAVQAALRALDTRPAESE